MSLVQQPLTLQFNGSGNQTIKNPDGSAVDETDNAMLLIVTTPQSGPPVPVSAAGATLDLSVNVLSLYSITTPPGAMVVG